jgi:uncharacterized membrane protein YuzA (DUF378 family)
MTKELVKSTAGKVAGWSLAVLVLVGAAAISGIADLSGKTGAMSKLFVFFLSAIIVIQVIPALMLLGAMLKGVVGIFIKKTDESKVASRK